MVHEELLEQCKTGSQKAQLEIYKLYYQAMYNTCLHIIRNEAEAEDIMQEAFLKAFSLLPKVNIQESFGGWLKKIVINKSLDALRKRKVHFEQVDNIQDKVEESQLWEETSETVNEKIVRVKRALNQLPDKYRTVLSLNLIEGYDHDEISGILGITASTSRAQLSRGKQKLLQLLN